MSRPDAAMLTASLMVRKGAAQPSRLFALPTALSETRPAPEASGPAPAPAAAPPRAPRIAATATKGRRRLTLRLDPDHHLRLKLAAAHLNLSLQELLLTALDAHLAREAPCACLGPDQK